ncbi:MAG TPA: hypothetical protein VGL08_11755 [Paraburkholderia sp.]
MDTVNACVDCEADHTSGRVSMRDMTPSVRCFPIVRIAASQSVSFEVKGLWSKTPMYRK